MGCAMPEAEQGMNVGRNIALLAGLPDTVPGMTVNRFCCSGLETINYGALKIAAGQDDVVIAGGVETMTMVPMGGLRYLPNPRHGRRAPRVPDQHGPDRREPGGARRDHAARRRTSSPTTAT